MRRTISKLFLILIVGAVLPYSGKAQVNKQSHPIRLKSGDLTPATNVATWADSMNAAGAFAQPVQAMIHFAAMPTIEEKEALARNGIQLLDYLPDNTYVAIITKQPNYAKTPSNAIFSIINTQPEWKADDYLWKKAARGNGPISVMISVFGGTSEAQVKEFVTSLGGQVTPGNMKPYGCYNVAIAASKLRNLAGWYAIRYVSPATEHKILDRQSIPAVKGNIGISPALWGGYGLNGDSVTVGVGDNTSGVFHTDVTDRVLNFNPAPPTNHGIHINCIVGGAAILDPLAMSMTPKVSLINFFFSNVLAATGQMLQDHNMTITNNSYTVVEDDCDYFGTYDLYSRYLDTLSLQYPTVQHVFAAGNDGELTCAPHAPGYGTMGGGYQPSKNTLVVGSVSNNLEPAWDQSKGPVRDGRLKPEIVAVGANVYSGIQNNAYKWAGGTSIASPQAASGLAVLTQRYKQTHAGTQPRADLIKTILINTAMDLGTPGPDFNYGYGMMDIGRALKAMDNNQYRTGDISTNDSQTYTISIPAGIARAKIMLCWNDIPASPSASIQLVNDLDLTVTTPGAARHFPLTLDGTTANELNMAIERPDHLNNTEQVTIENPAAGNYTFTVSGYNVPYGPQHYVLTYDLLPKELQLTYPLGGEQVSNTDSFRIFWNAVADGNTFNVALSTDNGLNWTTISNSVAATAHYIGMLPSGINSGKCKIRVRRNGTSEENTSGLFAISSRPAPVLSESQCPGYVNIHWSPIPNATSYEMLKKVGTNMKVVATTSDTTYSFSGMDLKENSIVAVQPVIDGLPGYRSLALVTKADHGDCLNPVSKGDLIVEKIVAPGNGRLLTNTDPGIASTVNVSVRNLYTQNCSTYVLSYKINGSAWQTLVNPGTVIPANGSAIIGIPGISFATPGNYDIIAAIRNTAFADPQSANDTSRYTMKCLPNAPLDLTTVFQDDFETMGKFSATHDSIGVSPNGHWDYFNQDDSGRMRSYVFDDVTISGSRSISLDQFMPMKHGSNNLFTGTFNLSGYDTAAHEVRVDFDYLLHGNPSKPGGNIITARGNDLSPWKTFFSYDLAAFPGYIKHVQSLSLTDAIRFGGNNFSTSTQVAFGQSDTSIIADRNYGNGITLDNFRLYTVSNDAMIAGIVSPEANNCGLPLAVPLTVKVRNGVNYTLHNVQLHYTMDNGSVYTGSLDSIRAKDSVNYTFTQPLNVASGTTHELNVWLSVSGDTYTLNDSLLHYKFRNSQIITNYPYLENFEAGDGGFYDGGFMSSWQYGTPASGHINKAASGTKAWKSNLTGKHNNLENSFLYSPCYDISQLSNPTLSLSMAQDLENCGNVLCDGAYLQYSFDGTNWDKLGAPGLGYNWYNSSFVIWNTIGFTRWHVATIGLPQPPAGKVLHLRFVLFSDPAVAFEGLAIDDIHIYDLVHGIQPTRNVSAAEIPVTNQWNDYVAKGKLLAAVQPATSAGNTTVSLFRQDTLSNPGKTQYIFPRSYAVSTEMSQSGPVKLRLFLEDSDFVAVLNDTTCPSCTPVTDAYSLGVTQFYQTDELFSANGSITDNINGNYEFHPHSSIQWIPYDKGYRAELQVSRPSEYWFNNGGPTGTFPCVVDYLNFLAFRSGDKAQILWHSLLDTSALAYTLERSDSGTIFKDLYQTNAIHSNSADYTFSDTTRFTTLPTRYYRLRWTNTGNNAVSYSPIRRVSANDSTLNLVQFDVATAGKRQIQLGWISFIDGLADNYIVERAIDDGSYETILNPAAAHWYGKKYQYFDSPDGATVGSLIRYRLTTVMTDGSRIVHPERRARLVDDNAVIGIYPNPTTNGSFSIRWNAEKGTGMRVSISDITGKLMDETTATATGWDNVTTIQSGNRPRGVYIIRMTIDANRFTSKIVFE